MDALEHRAHRRWPTWLHAVVQPESESCGRSGLILDLSLGGATIELDEWPEDQRGMLGLLGDGLRYLIPFVVVGVETTMSGMLVHAKFDGIDERCERFLADLLEPPQLDFDHSQRLLANRPNE